MLAVKPEYRRAPDYVLIRRLIERLWKDLLAAPINPKTASEWLTDSAKGILKKVGLFSVVKELIKK